MCIREDTVTVKGRVMLPGPGSVMLGTVVRVQQPRISEGGVFNRYVLACQLFMMANNTRQVPISTMPTRAVVPKNPFRKNVKVNSKGN